MNAKVLTLLVGLLVLLPVGYAADAQFGNCPSGFDCEETPDDGGPFPPDAVTAHTVYASFIMNRERNNTLGLPTDFAAVAGFFALIENRTVAVQRECVVWFNGYNLDQRPDPDNFGWGSENAFPSDEDQPLPPGGVPNHDEAYQDYDFDRDVDNCLPVFNSTVVFETSTFAVVVEAGDCAPDDGLNHRFRGHLDFVDPNNVYHEVQEYDYNCFFGGPKNVVPDGNFLFGLPSVSDVVKDFFPYTYTDEHNFDGCDVYETPLDNADPGAGDLGFFDFGHKCNGSLQDLFTERMWMTEIHPTVFDPTIDNVYNFALQIDTCAGWNIYEGADPLGLTGRGKVADGENNSYEDAELDPQRGGVSPLASPPAPVLDTYHGVAYHTYYSTGLDEIIGGWPLYDVCTDGSSYSFDDTPRGREVHAGPPAGIGDTAIMRGNSYDFDPGSPTVGKHRTNCRHNFISWPYNTFPPGPPPVGDDCYPEDHKTAQIDIYVFDEDPTGGLWAVNTNGLTGPGVPYTGPGAQNGPNEFPPYSP